MNRLLLFIAMGLTFCAHAQDEVVFQIKFKPSKVYTSTMITTTESVMNFLGDDATLSELKKSGVKLPIVVSGTSEVKTTSTTGKIINGQDVPVRVIYNEATNKQVINGETNELKSPISGLVLEGIYKGGISLKIDTLISQKIEDGMRSSFRKIIESMQQQIKFPSTPMKVGESFEQKLPMMIPLAGNNPVKILITTKYKLIGIRNQIAFFDVVQSVKLDLEVKQADISASGAGKGISQYDIVNQTLSKYDVSLNMELKMKMEDIVIQATIISQTKQVTTVN